MPFASCSRWEDAAMTSHDEDRFYEEPEGNLFGRLLDFLNRLERAHISYTVRHTRPDSIMADLSLPGWRWEVEFLADGSIDIERYRSVNGVENDPALIEELFANFSD